MNNARLVFGAAVLSALSLGLVACSAGSDHAPVGLDGSLPDGGSPSADGGPPGSETCDDGLDNDGDGMVDEDCFCVPGETASCYRGTAATRDVGGCHSGMMTCTEGLEFGMWGPCMDDALPGDEACDDGNVDDDCDGASNEGCDCASGSAPVPCGTDVGACTPGTQECVAGMLGECTGLIGPTDETCDNTDNDCDGTIDESLTRACGSSTGGCRPGTETCVGGAWEACSGGVGPTSELCDGVDNDCDGTTDEDITMACGGSVGICTPGAQSCSGGTWSMCSGGTAPGVETCNNLDDDCDGTTDEMLTRSCGSSTGACRQGTETCAAGAWGACAGAIGPGTEICDAGRIDEDCDGMSNEGCTCTAGTTMSCGTDVGLCSFGTQTCTTSGAWGPCSGGVGPATEICDRADNDCDGMTDEGGVCPTSPPIVMCGAAITAQVLTTVTLSGTGSDPDGGSVTYRWTVTSRPTGSTANPASPTSATTTFFLDASGSYTLQLCVTDDEGVMACCNIAITSTPPGVLHVELSWNTVYGDVDLHLLNVTRTADTGWWTTDDCFYANRTPDWGAAGAVANPTLDRDDTDGNGPENTTINMSPASGTYTVGVHYYCQHSLGSGAAAGDGPTEGTVRVYCGGALIATYTGLSLDRTDRWLDVATVDYPSCVGRSFSRTLWGSGVLPPTWAGALAPHCEIPCTSDSSCPPAERCATVGGGGPPRNACILR